MFLCTQKKKFKKNKIKLLQKVLQRFFFSGNEIVLNRPVFSHFFFVLGE